MSNQIKVLNSVTFQEITTITDLIEPHIYEEINSSYVFTFDKVLNEKTKYLKYPNIIEIDGDYFKISKTFKRRNESVISNFECEHISYELNDDDESIEDGEDEFEGTPESIANSLLRGTRFTTGLIEIGGSVYFRPRAKSIRGRLIELANYIGGELLWNKFTISILYRRGENNGLEFELGENIIGVTEEVDTSDKFPRKSYEVDVVDLAQLPEYAFLSTVNLGDTVRILDPIIPSV